jgi:hypothetical protein
MTVTPRSAIVWTLSHSVSVLFVSIPNDRLLNLWSTFHVDSKKYMESCLFMVTPQVDKMHAIAMYFYGLLT